MGKNTNDCVCGCGSPTQRYFAQGHDQRFKGYLIRIANGDNKPSDFFDRSAVRKLGPWTPTENGGKAPTNDYTVLREAA